MKICQYLCLHMKIICWRFHVKIPFTFWVTRMWDMWNVCLQTFRDNKICWKLVYFLRNLQTLRANNSRILRIKNAKFSRYCFYMNTNIKGDFRIYFTVPLRLLSDFKEIFFTQYRFPITGIRVKCFRRSSIE